MRFALSAILACGVMLGAVAATAQAPAAPEPAEPWRQCFASRSVNSFAQQDNRTINIRVGVRDYYRLTTLSDCRDATFGPGLAIQSHTQFICKGLDVTLIIPDSLGLRRCEVQTIHKLTEAEVAALPRNAKP